MITSTINKLDNSQVEIVGEIPTDIFSGYRSLALESLGRDVEIDGFRKGKAPEKVLADKIGDDRILVEMAELALAEAYPKLLIDNKIEAIGRPEITLTKLTPGNPLGFKIVTAVMPEVTLPKDYAKIAGGVMAEPEEAVEATDNEVNEMIENIRKSRAIKVEGKEEPELPELTDEFAKSLGQFETAEDLKTKIRENLTLEKTNRNKEKRRLKAVEAIGEKTEMTPPQVMMDAEIEKMLGEMRMQIEQMGLTFDDYLKHISKTEDDLRTIWKGDAEKRVRFGLIMDALAKAEKIEAPAEELDKEVQHLLAHHQEADPLRVRSYAEHIIVNEKVFQFLESQK